jgi:CRP/FNR family cyclic AMP-dependent transcriptional regulator
MLLSQNDQVTMEKRIVFLRKVPLFSLLSERELNSVSGHFHARLYQKDQLIFHQGDDSRKIYVVLRGKVRIFSVTASGGETSLRIFSVHDTIGEFAAIDDRPRSTAAQALVSSVLLEMEQSRFLTCLREMPDLSIGLLRMLVDKLRWTTSYAEIMAQYDAKGRLLYTLLDCNRLFGTEIEPGKRYQITLPLNQTRLASMVGVRREWINRIFREWQVRGLVEYRQNRITILDRGALEEEWRTRMEACGDLTWW